MKPLYDIQQISFHHIKLLLVPENNNQVSTFIFLLFISLHYQFVHSGKISFLLWDDKWHCAEIALQLNNMRKRFLYLSDTCS